MQGTRWLKRRYYTADLRIACAEIMPPAPHEEDDAMRGLGRAFAAVSTLALFVSAAHAQGGRGMGMGSPITNKSVQEELKLAPEQVSKVQTLADSLREKMRPEFQKLQDLAPEERMEKMQELARSSREETVKGLKDILQVDQLKRYQEIVLQQRGFDAMSEAEVQAKLNLSADQKDKIKGLQADFVKGRQEIFQNAQDNPQGAFPKFQALRKETQEKAMALLSADQKKSWKEMTGEPFEIKFEPPRQRQAN
jgi:hypothetical protein